MKNFTIICIFFFVSLTHLFAQFETDKSFIFNGSNSARISESSFPTPNYVTITAWIYLNSSGAQTIASKNYATDGTTNTGQFEIFINSSNQLNFLSRVSGTDNFSGSSGTLETGKWYFVIGKFDGSNVQSFLNAVSQATSAISGVIDNTTPHPFSVGAQDNPSSNRRNYFNGIIDNLAVWNTALDITTIKDWMHCEITSSHPYYSNLMAYYKFNGASYNSYLWDATSNGRNLLITGDNINCYSSTLPPKCYTYGDLLTDYKEIRGIWSTNLSNSSSILTISAVSISGSGYALLGHNNHSVVWSYFDAPAGVQKRLDRVWLNETSGFNCDFIFNTSGLTIEDGSRLRMLVDEDGSFYNADIVTGSYNALNHTFTVSNYPITDEYQYTLAILTESGSGGGVPTEPPAWKYVNPAPQGNHLFAVGIINNKIIGMGDMGTIVSTTNEGSTWATTFMVNNNNNRINDLTVQPGTNHLYAVGDKGEILKSTNEGLTWTRLSDVGIPDDLIFSEINYINPDDGFISGGEGSVYKTTTGGTNWQKLDSKLTGNIATLDFYDENYGWAFDDFTYAITTNGGNNWEWKFNSPGQVLSSLCLSSTDGFVSTADGSIYKTTDFGTNWVKTHDGTTPINKMTKIGGGVLAIGNTGTILKTTNNGDSWTSPTSGVTDDLLNIYVNANKVAISAKNGVVLSSNDLCETVNKISGGITGSFHGIKVISPTLMLAIGGHNKFYKSTDGGKTWNLINTGNESDSYKSLDFKNANNGFVVGDDGKLRKTSDGGTNWNDISLASTNDISSIKVQSISDKGGTNTYILYTTTTGSNDNQILAKSIDDGINWAPVRSVGSSANDLINSFTLVNSIIYACTKNGQIIKSIDDGNNWTTTTLQSSTEFTEISFSDVNNGFVVGKAGALYKTINAGNEWTLLSNCTNLDINHISAITANIALLSTTTGNIYKTTDGGTTWNPTIESISNTINQLTWRTSITKSDYAFFAIGDGGMILMNEEDGVGLFPVELVSFTATITNNIITLNWQTATEINNYGFEIQKINNDSKYISIGFVKGCGNSNVTNYYSFIDNNIITGNQKYRLKQIDIDGNFNFSKEIEISVFPTKYELFQNYPNPFNPNTSISFSLPKNEFVTLKIYDILGKEITSLINEELPAGNYIKTFDATNLSSGVYFYTIKAGSFNQTKKMILTK